MAQYEKVFTKPYEDGYVDLPNQTTPITAETLNDKDTAIEHIENFLDGQEFPTALADLSDDETHRLVTDTEIAEWNNKIDSTAVEEQTTTGQFTTKTGGKLESCIVAFEPVQSGSGDPSPSNVRPITGHSSVEVWEHGKNLIGIGTQLNGFVTSGNQFNPDNSAIGYLFETKYLPNTITFNATNGNRAYVAYFNTVPQNGTSCPSKDQTSQVLPRTITVDKTYPYIHLQLSYGVTNLSDIQVEEGSEDTDYVPYQGQYITVSLGNTYYSGTLNLISGDLEVEQVAIDMGDLTWTPSSGLFVSAITGKANGKTNFLCEAYNPVNKDTSSLLDGEITGASSGSAIYAKNSNYTYGYEFKSAVTGKKIVYELSAIQIIKLTPQQINTLIGENNIDVPLTGQSLTSAVYRELFAWDDVTDVVEEVDAKKADITAIGTDESGRTTASRDYRKGENFYKDGKFCTAKTAVASGATWTLNTNYEESSIASKTDYEETIITAATGITLDYNQVRRFGKVVDIWLAMTTPSTSMTSDNILGSIPFKPSATYAFLDVMSTTKPYANYGKVFIRATTREVILPKGIPASTTIYITGQYICQ